MSITNTVKPSSSLTNSSKVSIGETWGSILTTWATETRSWLKISQLITNTAFGFNRYLLQQNGSFLLLQGGDKIILNPGTFITNTLKPIYFYGRLRHN